MKISDGSCSSYEGSPARLVDSMWEAGNKKSYFFDITNNMMVTSYLTKIFSREKLNIEK